MNSEILRELREHNRFIGVTNGTSMYPMLKNRISIVEIVPCDKDLKSGDIALYRSADEGYTLHRIIKLYNDYYVICGDNRWRNEHVDKERVIGVVTRFKTDGVWTDMTDPSYLEYVKTVPWRRRWVFIKHLYRKIARLLTNENG